MYLPTGASRVRRAGLNGRRGRQGPVPFTQAPISDPTRMKGSSPFGKENGVVRAGPPPPPGAREH